MFENTCNILIIYVVLCPILKSFEYLINCQEDVGEGRRRTRPWQCPDRGGRPQVRGRAGGGQDQEDAQTKVCSFLLAEELPRYSTEATGKPCKEKLRFLEDDPTANQAEIYVLIWS